MKRISISCVLLLIALGVSAAGLDDLIKQAGLEYAGGSTAKALATLGIALSTNPAASAEKRSLSDAYAEIGVKEYDRKNYKNAFECFKNAVKLYPSNQLATKYFWKMKGEMNVEALRNEADEAAQKSAVVAQGSGPATAAVSPAGTDTAAYRETAEKLARTEQELAAIRAAALSATQESAAVKAELERQKMLAEQQRDELLKTSQAAREESMSLKSDLGQYKVLIDQLNARVQKSDQSAGKDTRVLTDMISLFQQNLEKQNSADKVEAQRIADQLAEQRRLLDAQNQTLSSRNMLLIGGLALVFLLAILFIFLLVRAQLRRKRAWRARETAVPYNAMALGRESAMEERGHNGGSGSLLLDFYPETSKFTEAETPGGEAGMYRDLMKAERIRRMHEQMKQGTLKWETVREYVGELEKDLRVEILRVVESKILEGEGADPRALLPILSAFLTEHDDYLREKAENLVRDALAGGPHGGTLLPSYGQEAPPDADDSPLGLPKLLEITENLKKILKDRERSVATAKVARGMARSIGLTAADTELLYKAALAHDAGYLRLDPDKLTRILAKPVLSEQDFDFVRSHARKGVEYFKGSKLPQELKDAILSHHERNDGSGYPKGLTGAKIPLFAKIIGVAETWVALTSARPYREKLGREAALAVIRDGVGRKFDREHVEALAEMTRRGGGSS